jgi:unsaturated rhamnogalacturonyl hydrolase
VRAWILAAITLTIAASCPGCSKGHDSPACPAPLPPATPANGPEITLARAIADRYVAVHPPESLAWDWGEGVLMSAMADLYVATRAQPYADYVKAWLDFHVAGGYAIAKSDDCPPAISAVTVYQTSCGDSYAQIDRTVLDFLYTTALRTPDGGISHFGASPIFGTTLWIDSLFMFGEVLIRWGEATNDVRALDEYGKQYTVFASHLQDPSGFFTHAYQWPGQQDPGVFWARGNGWVIASGFDYLRVRKARGEHDDAVSASLAKLAGAVTGAQDASGLWWTVVNKPGATYLETSASALFAYGLARGKKQGALDASVVPIVQRAVAGLKTKITNDAQGRPQVTGISGATDVGPFTTYASVKQVDDLHFGVGAVILALLESSGL